MLNKLQDIVSFAFNSSHSSWYREFCKDHGIATCPSITRIEEFQRLPLLDRDALNQFAPLDRLSSEMDLVDNIRSTSGTSGQAPLFYFRSTRYHQLARRQVRDGARRKLYLWGYQHVVTHIEDDRQAGLQTIICDPNHMTSHLPLVSHLSIDMLAGTPSLLLMFGQLLNDIDDRLRIRSLELTGEPARPQTLASLKALFPLAKFYSLYAMGEFGQEMGIRMPNCQAQPAGFFHLNPEGIYAEKVDGELVVTHLAPPLAFPLIRYRTGDQIGRLSEIECPCGLKGMSFELSGRANVDFVRVAGVEIRHEEIAAIVAGVEGASDAYVAAEVSEHVSQASQTVSLKVKTVASETSTTPKETLVQELQEALVDNLRLSATTRLKDMMALGLFAAPKVELISEAPVSTKSPGIRMVDV